MSHPAGATSSSALPPPRTAWCSHFWFHGMFNWMLLYATTASQRWRSAVTWPLFALHRRHASCEHIWSAQKTLKRDGSSEGAGGPSTPFSSRLPHWKPHARRASTPTNPRLCDRTSSDNESQALPKRQSHDVADSSGRHKAQVRCDDVHAREHTS